MARGEWFRHKTWEPADQAEFFSRLDRSRGKAQHLRIQAATLLDSRDPDLLSAAVDLTTLAIEDHPDALELPTLHHLRGRAKERLGDTSSALDDYRAAAQAEASTHVQVDAYLDFGWLVAVERMESLYAEALAMLKAGADRPTFPVQKYRHQAAAALILDAMGNSAAARSAALQALSAASGTTSGLQRHSAVGLVEESDPTVRERLWQIAL